jgi:outer membrane receptor for ferrienterochelin and colicins
MKYDMVRKLTTILLCVMCSVQLWAQKTDAMLFGDVKSAATGEHIPYATITVKGTNLKTMADATGHFKMTNLPVGRQTIVAQAVGYKPQQIDKDMTSAQGTEVSVYTNLQPIVASFVAIAIGQDSLTWDKPVSLILVLASAWMVTAASQKAH